MSCSGVLAQSPDLEWPCPAPRENDGEATSLSGGCPGFHCYKDPKLSLSSPP